MAIKTPDVLPGEPGYVPKKDRTKAKRLADKRRVARERKAEGVIPRLRMGSSGFRLGRSSSTSFGRKFPLWRYSKKIGEVSLSSDGVVSLSFRRFGRVGSFKHLIQDASFQLEWATREQELLLTQDRCFLCKKRLSKSAKPNLYHYKFFQKSLEAVEEAESVPSRVVSGELSVEEGWDKFNEVLESANRYYMSLEDTALVCSSCAKQKNLQS